MPRLVARLVIATLLWAGAPWAAAAGTAFLVAAPDRGFLGNEEIRDQFDRFADRHAARLVFVTDARTTASIQSASEALAAEGASELVVLPLFLSRGEARFARLRAAIEASSALPVRWARPWGETYLAVEFLADRLAG
ncbi:MAG: hypothetical protein KDH20_06720, partial [Rhodocyclaceae bacterium]|nr:hypothetical protein [Rhodocyclaceae bacterium]